MCYTWPTMASQISLIVTKNAIKLSIPKALIKRERKELTEKDVLRLVARGRRDIEQGKGLIVNSLDELVD